MTHDSNELANVFTPLDLTVSAAQIETTKLLFFSFTPQTKKTTVCLHKFFKAYIFRPYLTSTVHKFPNISSSHDLIGAQIVSKLASNGHDDGHDKVGKCRNYPNL